MWTTQQKKKKKAIVLRGYARISTADQNSNYSLSVQEEKLKEFGIQPENIVKEVGSATTILQRPLLKDLLENQLQAGDTLVVVSLDRFSQKILDTIVEVNHIHEKKAFFRSLNGPLISDWSRKEDIFQMMLYSFLAQSELENRKARTRAKEAKKYKGRATKITSKLLRQLKGLLAKDLKPKQICAVLAIVLCG